MQLPCEQRQLVVEPLIATRKASLVGEPTLLHWQRVHAIDRRLLCSDKSDHNIGWLGRRELRRIGFGVNGVALFDLDAFRRYSLECLVVGRLAVGTFRPGDHGRPRWAVLCGRFETSHRGGDQRGL